MKILIIFGHPDPGSLNQFRRHRVGVADPEVVDPARDGSVQFVDDVLHPMAPVTPGEPRRVNGLRKEKCRFAR